MSIFLRARDLPPPSGQILSVDNFFIMNFAPSSWAELPPAVAKTQEDN